jgi:hypothetical protein
MLEETPLSPELSRRVPALARAGAGSELAQLVALAPEDPAIRTPAGRSCAVAGASAGSLVEAVGPGTAPIDPLTYN